MQELVLAGNKLQSIPEQIAKLTSLRRLQLAGNRLAALPDVITTMDHLQASLQLCQAMPNAAAPTHNSLDFIEANLRQRCSYHAVSTFERHVKIQE